MELAGSSVTGLLHPCETIQTEPAVYPVLLLMLLQTLAHTTSQVGIIILNLEAEPSETQRLSSFFRVTQLVTPH